jgi:hypothetical protein
LLRHPALQGIAPDSAACPDVLKRQASMIHPGINRRPVHFEQPSHFRDGEKAWHVRRSRFLLQRYIRTDRPVNDRDGRSLLEELDDRLDEADDTDYENLSYENAPADEHIEAPEPAETGPDA